MADRDGTTIDVDGHEIEVSNLDKVLFPKDGLTKGDLIDYYRRISEVALPYYRDRPLSMQRFPDGIAAEGFFQKNVEDYFPDWIDRVELAKEGGSVVYAIANDAATLAYLANLACITPHLSLSRRDRVDHPDRLVFDLDPSDDDFAKVLDAARRLKSLLDELTLPGFVMTTGSRGLHVVVPLDRSTAFDTVRDFAHDLASHLARCHPDHLTVEHRKSKRGRRVFVDYLRNAYGQTAVAPYAVRAKDGAPVATPLRWEELDRDGLGPQSYTVRNIFQRLGQTDDPWAGIDSRASAIDTARATLADMTNA